MSKVRKDSKGRVLHRGETYRKDKGLYSFSYTDPMGTRRYIYSGDLGKLREKEKQVTYDRLDGIDIYALARSDLNYVFDRYISTKSELRSTTKTNYICTYNRYVRKGFGKKKISEIRYSDVLLYYKALMTTQNLKVSTIESVHSCLHPTFQMAVRDNVIRSNPSDGVIAEIKKKQKGRPEARHALTYEQEKEFLTYLDEPQNVRYRPLFTVMFGTGLRIGEIIALRWKDVNFKDNYITVDHSITYYPRVDKGNKSEFEVSLPKTAAGIRTVPLLDKVKEALLEEKAYQKETGNTCIMEVDGMSGFIFFNRFGMLHKPGAINRLINRIVNDHNAKEEVRAVHGNREAVLIPHFSCHVTRHTFCSRLCENETNVKVIQSVMGHKEIQTTLDIYAEISESKRQEVFKELNCNNVI